MARARRPRVLVFGLVLAVLFSAGGLTAGQWIKSPQQAAADAAAPARAMLTAPVEQRVLKDTVVLRGTVGAGRAFEVTPVPDGAGRAVVTRVQARVGDRVKAGTVLLEVAGRPLIALPGSIPVYRDLRPGSSGRDVRQLQQALRAVGHDPGRISGTFDEGTERALRALYTHLGYETVANPEVSAAALDEAGSAVRAGEQALADARSAAPKGTATRDAEQRLADARRTEAKLRAQAGPMLPAAEVVYLPSFPARVNAVGGRVGDEVKAPLITLSSGALVVRADLNPAQRILLKEGMTVRIDSELDGLTGNGRIESIGALQENDAGNRTHPAVITAVGKPFDPKLFGVDVRLTVEAASTDEAVLVVPLTALYATADGTSGVLRRRPDGGSERVVVTPGISGDGYVAVTPVSGELKAGDAVVVGSSGG